MSSSALEFSATRGELAVVAAILEHARTSSSTSSSFDGVPQLDSDAVIDILQRSNLADEVLASIWLVADEDGDGNLSERELAIAVRLIGWAQSGKPVNGSFVNYSNGPLPTLKDIWESEWDNSPAPVQLPPVNLHDKIEFHRAFREAGPVNGLLDGDKVRDIFLKANMSFDEIDRIRDLIDRERRGSLNNIEFAVGMYIIQSLKTCQLTTLPASIPPHIYDQLSVKSNSPFATPRPPPKSAPLPWKSPSLSVKNVAAQILQASAEQWDVSVIEQAEANGHFDSMDAEKDGLVDGNESAQLMLKFFKLPPSDVAQIWDLVDLRRDNKLNKDQLAVAVHLIHRRLEGNELPSPELPSSLIPPSMRSKPSSPHIRRASAPPVPQKKPPPPPPPSSRKPSLSMSKPLPPILKRATSLSPVVPSNFRPPRAIKPELKNRFSIAAIPESSSPIDNNSPVRALRSPFTSPNDVISQNDHDSPGHTLRPPPVSLNHIPSPNQHASNYTVSPGHIPSPNHGAPPTLNIPSDHITSPIPVASPASSPFGSPSPNRTNPIDQEMFAELKAETKQLKLHIQELMAQLKSQNHHRDQNDELKQENERLKRKLQEMEVDMSQILQANERADRTEELTHEVSRLNHLLSEHENTEAELRETLDSVAELSQKNQSLKQDFEDLKLEKTSVEKELAEVEHKLQNLQGEKNSISTRMSEMERLLVDPQAKGSSKRELQMLLKDVTRENEELKLRERDMQQQMSTILLTSRNHTQLDDLKRENSRLRLDVEEWEGVVRGLQASNSDNQLRRRIEELEREKEGLNSSVGEMARRVQGVEELSGRRIGELQSRCRELEAANQNLRRQRTVTAHHDDNAPPPAYEELSAAT